MVALRPSNMLVYLRDEREREREREGGGRGDAAKSTDFYWKRARRVTMSPWSIRMGE